MFLSVIIPTKNRVNSLKNAIKSLLDQSLDKKYYEIVVMDQSTNSKTREFINKLVIGNNCKIRYIYNKILGLHSNRNIGAKKARGSILVFVDDDIIADKNYLRAIYDSFLNDPDIALMTGRVIPLYKVSKVPEWINFFWNYDNNGKYLLELGLLDLGCKYKEISPDLAFGGNCMVRKNIFYKYKGTNPDAFPMEMIKYSGNSETALGYKIRKDRLKIVYNPNITIKHLVTKERLTPEYFYNRNYFEGIKNSYTDIRKTRKKLPIKQILRDFYILFRNIFIIILKFYLKPNRINFVCSLYRFKGKFQHKIWVLKDKELFQYILRDNYFDDGKEFLTN